MTSTLPTLRGLEHVSMTVPDLDEATAFFVDMFGCQTMYTMGPFSATTGGAKGSFMRTYANADVRAVVENVRVLRSPFLNLELFQATYPGQRTTWPDLQDVGGWQLTAGVDDLDAAIRYASSRGVVILGEEKQPTAGSDASDGGWGCQLMTPWGFRFELVTSPTSLHQEGDPSFTPRGGLPTFRGFEQLSLTVPDVDQATRLFVDLLGAEQEVDRQGVDGHGVDREVSGGEARLLRSDFLTLKLLQCSSNPGTDRLWPGMLDIGGWHLAFYVDDVDAALDHLASLDLWVLGGKKPAYLYEAGDEAYTVHCLTPFGLYFELVTYPSGRYRAAEFAAPSWHPSQRSSSSNRAG